MNSRRAPALFPDDFVPRIANLGPEFLHNTVKDVEIGGVIGGAGDVAVAEVQHSIGGKADSHYALTNL